MVTESDTRSAKGLGVDILCKKRAVAFMSLVFLSFVVVPFVLCRQLKGEEGSPARLLRLPLKGE